MQTECEACIAACCAIDKSEGSALSFADIASHGGHVAESGTRAVQPPPTVSPRAEHPEGYHTMRYLAMYVYIWDLQAQVSGMQRQRR